MDIYLCISSLIGLLPKVDGSTVLFSHLDWGMTLPFVANESFFETPILCEDATLTEIVCAVKALCETQRYIDDVSTRTNMTTSCSW